MAKYSISTIHTGILKEGVFNADEFVLHLRNRWHAVEIHPTTDPKNPYLLEWRAQIGTDIITGRLGRKHYYVEFSGNVDAAARFAVWYRTLVPLDYRLNLSQVETATEDYHNLELEQDTSESAIIAALTEQPARKRKRETDVTWRVIPGGHLGKLSEHQAAIQSLFVTPNEDLWATVAPGASVYVQGRWQQTSASQTVVHTQGYWHHIETPYMPGIWYHDQLWGVAEQGFVMYDHGTWRSAGMVPFSSVTCFVADSMDQLWVGTLLHGLWRTIDGRHWEQIQLPSQGLSIGALWSDAENTIWVAESGQRPASRPVYRWREGMWDALPLPPKPKGFHRILHLTTDAVGHLWVGTSVSGVWLWDNKTWTHFMGTRGDAIGLPGSSISGLRVDVQQRIWALTHNGIGCFASGVWRLVLVAPAPPSHERVLQLWNTPSAYPCSCYLAKDRRLWIGTTDGQVGWIDTTQNFYDDAQQYIIVDYEPPLSTIKV
jgi:hypothetical protein